MEAVAAKKTEEEEAVAAKKAGEEAAGKMIDDFIVQELGPRPEPFTARNLDPDVWEWNTAAMRAAAKQAEEEQLLQRKPRRKQLLQRKLRRKQQSRRLRRQRLLRRRKSLSRCTVLRKRQSMHIGGTGILSKITLRHSLRPGWTWRLRHHRLHANSLTQSFA